MVNVLNEVATLEKLAREMESYLPGWSQEPHEYNQRGYLHGAEGQGIVLGLDVRAGVERVEVWGAWPLPVNDASGSQLQFIPFRDRPSITVALSRGAKAIARDIERRFLPKYFPLWEKMAEERRQAIIGVAEELAALERLEEAGCTFGHDKSRAHIVNGDTWGNATVSGYGGMSVTFELRRVPLDIALGIVRLIMKGDNS